VIYCIKRGPMPEHHNAPFHPVIVCDNKDFAKWEAGWTDDKAWVWSHESGCPECGWLLDRWNGFDIDYGHIVRSLILPDGSHGAIAHRHRDRGYDRTGPEPKWLGYTGELQEPWSILTGATWWSSKKMPAWIEALGVLHPADTFSRNNIMSRAVFGHETGCDMQARYPSWWPMPAPVPDLVPGVTAYANNLAVYHNEDDWVVAESAEESREICAANYGVPLDEVADFAVCAPETTLAVHEGDPDNASERREQTMAQWAAEQGKRFLCSINF
jgi:hypothetical protein